MYKKLLIVLLTCLFSSNAIAARELNVLNFAKKGDRTRIVMAFNKPFLFHAFTLKHPERLVIDFRDTKRKIRLHKKDYQNTIIRTVRTGVRHGRDLRVVFELSQLANDKLFTLKPKNGGGYRLVADLFTKKK